VSTPLSEDHGAARDTPADGSAAVSRPSKNNRHGHAEGAETGESEIAPSDIPGKVGLRPLSVGEGVSLRDEAVLVDTPEGFAVPAAELPDDDPDGEARARPTYRVVEAWRDWMKSYESAHIEYESPDGETVRTRLENSYQQQYDKRYYARLKDLERGVERRWGDSLTTAMLTFSASHENANGNARCPADHMREIAEGWRDARKLLHKKLSRFNWEYARVWEPHEDGYGHLHVAVFVEDRLDAITPETFGPVMENYVDGVTAAGTDAHTNSPCEACATAGDWNGGAEPSCDDCDTPVSISHDVGSLAGYISEYLGIYGDRALDRPLSEQLFYATTWATGTRRLDFSNGAQEIIAGEEFRRETGLRPEDRGGTEGRATPAESDESDGDGETWGVDSICYVSHGGPDYADPTVGGESRTEIEGRPGVDPPARRD